MRLSAGHQSGPIQHHPYVVQFLMLWLLLNVCLNLCTIHFLVTEAVHTAVTKSILTSPSLNSYACSIPTLDMYTVGELWWRNISLATQILNLSFLQTLILSSEACVYYLLISFVPFVCILTITKKGKCNETLRLFTVYQILIYTSWGKWAIPVNSDTPHRGTVINLEG